MQSTFTETQATFQVHAKQLEPEVDYQLLARESEDTLPEQAGLDPGVHGEFLTGR